MTYFQSLYCQLALQAITRGGSRCGRGTESSGELLILHSAPGQCKWPPISALQSPHIELYQSLLLCPPHNLAYTRQAFLGSKSNRVTILWKTHSHTTEREGPAKMSPHCMLDPAEFSSQTPASLLTRGVTHQAPLCDRAWDTQERNLKAERPFSNQVGFIGRKKEAAYVTSLSTWALPSNKGVSLPASDIYNIQHTTCYRNVIFPPQKIYTCWKNVLKQQNLPSLTWLLIYWLQQHSGQSWQLGVFWSQKDGFSQLLEK